MSAPNERRRREDELAKLACEGNYSLADRITYEFNAVHGRLDGIEDKLDKLNIDREDHRVRLSLLEQADRDRKWWTGTAITAGISAIVLWVWDKLTRGG